MKKLDETLSILAKLAFLAVCGFLLLTMVQIRSGELVLPVEASIEGMVPVSASVGGSVEVKGEVTALADPYSPFHVFTHGGYD